MAMPLSVLLEYKQQVMNLLKTSQPLLALLANDPNIDPASDKAASIQEQCFFDYSFTDDTFQRDNAVVFVEMDMTRNSSYQFKGLKIRLQVICNKQFVTMDPTIWKGEIGNRRDRLCAVISDILEDSDDFGIGELMLTAADPVSVPNGFTGYGLDFTAVAFADRDDDYED